MRTPRILKNGLAYWVGWIGFLLIGNSSSALGEEIVNALGDGLGNGLDRPGGVAVDNFGVVYVAGRDSNNVLRVAPSGQVTEIMDSLGDGAGNLLDVPTGVAVDSLGNVYVCSALNDRVFRIEDPGGNNLITTILDGAGDGLGNQLIGPWAIEVDGQGNVFVAGQASENVFRVTPDGAISEIIDRSGDGLGNELFLPFALDLDSSGNVYVLGISGNAFEVLDPGGANLIRKIIDATGDGKGNTLNGALGLAVHFPKVYVAGAATDNVFEVDLITDTVSLFLDGSGDGRGNLLDAPYGVATTQSGDVFVSCLLSSNVFVVTPEGLVLEVLDGEGANLGGPDAIATSVFGRRAYVAGTGSDNVFEIRSFVESFGPRGGVFQGGNIVRFRGHGFSDSTTITFDGVPGVAQVSDFGVLDVVVPPSANAMGVRGRIARSRRDVELKLISGSCEIELPFKYSYLRPIWDGESEESCVVPALQTVNKIPDQITGGGAAIYPADLAPVLNSQSDTLVAVRWRFGHPSAYIPFGGSGCDDFPRFTAGDGATGWIEPSEICHAFPEVFGAPAWNVTAEFLHLSGRVTTGSAQVRTNESPLNSMIINTPSPYFVGQPIEFDFGFDSDGFIIGAGHNLPQDQIEIVDPGSTGSSSLRIRWIVPGDLAGQSVTVNVTGVIDDNGAGSENFAFEDIITIEP